MDRPEQAGKSSKFARHSPLWARIWPADDEKPPVSKGQQRMAKVQLDNASLPMAARQATAQKALLRQRFRG